MRILLVHYAYFITGGPERYLFNVQRLLKEKGHKVIPFSMKNRANLPSEYSKYFASAINNDGSWYYSKKSGTKSKFKQIRRLFYSKEVEHKLSQLIVETKPDIAYVLLYNKKLSPAVLVACKKHGLPVVSRLSDFQLMCPKYTFYRAGNICEKCKNSRLYSIKYRCIKNSFLNSSLWYLAETYHKCKQFNNIIDVYVITNPFMKIKLREYGHKKECHVIRTCSAINQEYSKAYSAKKANLQICYVGNIFEHKGVDLLLESFSKVSQTNSNLKLIVMGNDTESIFQNDKLDYYRLQNIHYISHSSKKKVLEVLAESLFFVLPSKWYENLPNTIIESFSVGTPVITSNIGSLRYMIEDGKTGFLFDKGSSESLTSVLNRALNFNEKKYGQMQRSCLNQIKFCYSYEYHYQSLIGLFSAILRKKNISNTEFSKTGQRVES